MSHGSPCAEAAPAARYDERATQIGKDRDGIVPNDVPNGESMLEAVPNEESMVAHEKGLVVYPRATNPLGSASSSAGGVGELGPILKLCKGEEVTMDDLPEANLHKTRSSSIKLDVPEATCSSSNNLTADSPESWEAVLSHDGSGETA